MKKSPASVDHVPQCALNSQETGNTNPRSKGDNSGKPFARFSNNRGSINNLQNIQRTIKPEYSGIHELPSHLENSNTSWDGEWTRTSSPSFSKNSSSGGYYKQRTTPSSFHSSSNDYSTGESSTSSPAPSSYAGMQASQPPAPNCISASPSSYYENSIYGSNYNYDSNASGYAQPPYRSLHQPQPYHPSARPFDAVTGSYNGNRNPSSCPQTPIKQPAPEYNQRNSRYGMENTFNKLQIKREPDDYGGENFTSVFTQSLTSLYSEDPDNGYQEDGNEPDVIVCTPPSNISNIAEAQTNYQRLGPSDGQYNSSSTNFHTSRNNYGYYENRSQNIETAADVVEIGSENERTSSFRYDRPSFDDMHLYASPNDSKTQAKKRKLSMPNIAPEGNFGTEARRKVPRMSSFKSDSKWTPNSFAFSDVQVKQEPEDDYPTLEKEPTNSKSSVKDNSFNNNGNNNSKSPSQQEHPKPPPRKRSPAATCFDRFEKKSTPTNKKVSPLSVYAKVQDGQVLSLKCRRYKKRTKPIVTKEELVYPGREEIENWKRTGAYSQTPDHAVRILMGDLLERVSQVDGKSSNSGPDLMRLDSSKVRELLFQFCQRYSIEFRDFEDIQNVLKPCIVEDKIAKNSERASAIRKRINVSPAPKESKELACKTSKVGNVPKKANNKSLKPEPKRVLRNLPGREQMPEAMEIEIRPSRRRSRKTPIVSERRYSTRSVRDGNDKNSDVDIVIDSSTDRESEAGKEAEVRKKSDRTKNKLPVTEKPAKSKNQDMGENISKKASKDLPSGKTKEKSKERDCSKEQPKIKDSPRKKWSRKQSDFRGILRSSSIEIVDITSCGSSSPSDSKKDSSESENFIKKRKKNNRKSRNSSASSSERYLKPKDKITTTSVIRKNNIRNQDKKDVERNANDIESGSNSKTKIGKKFNESSEKDIQQSQIDSCSKSKRKGRSSKRNDKNEGFTNNDKKSKQNDSNCSSEREKSNNSRKQDRSKSNSKSAKEHLPSEESSVQKNSNTKDSNFDAFELKDNQISEEKLKITPVQDSKSPLEKKLEYKNTMDRQNSLKKFSKLENVSNNSDEKEVDATGNEKLSALQPYSKSNIPNRIHPKSQSKQTSKVSHKDDSTLDSLQLIPKVTEKHVIDGIKAHKPTNFPIKKRNKIVQIAVNKPDIVNSKEKIQSEETRKEVRNVEVQNKVAKSSSRLPDKHSLSRHNSQHSDSEPRVVLRKLPDVHINSKKSTIPLDYFEKYVSKEINRPLVFDEVKSKCSDDSSSVGSPPQLVCMNEIFKEDDERLFERESLSKLNSEQKEYLSAPLPLIHCDELMRTAGDKSSEKLERFQPVRQFRYSADSEDSECRLVMDLDRSVSFEKENSSVVLNDMENVDEIAESPVYKPEIITTDSAIVPDTILNDHIDSMNILKVENNIIKIEPGNDKTNCIKKEPRNNDSNSELTNDILNNNLSEYTLKSEQGDTFKTTTTDKLNTTHEISNCSEVNNFSDLKTEIGESISLEVGDDSKKKEQDDSILRTLLLDKSCDGSTGPSQPSTSSDVPRSSRNRIPEGFRQFMMSPEWLSSSENIDSLDMISNIRSVFENLNRTVDLKPGANINWNLLSDTEKLVMDSRMIKVQLDKLKHEMMYLQYLTYQNENESIDTVNIKGSPTPRSASAVLKEANRVLSVTQGKLWALIRRLENSIKTLDNNLFPNYMDDLKKQIFKKFKKHSLDESQFNKLVDYSESEYLTQSSSPEKTTENEPHARICHHFLEMAAISMSLAHYGLAAAVVANENRNSTVIQQQTATGEQLPTVETMVAKATENYGIDLRTPKTPADPTTSPILEKVLSAKEPISNHFAPSVVSEVHSDSNSSLHLGSPVKLPRKIPSGCESPFKPVSSLSSDRTASQEGLSQKILLKVLSEGSKNPPSTSQFLPALKKETKLNVENSHIQSTSCQDIPLDFSLEKKSELPAKPSDESPTKSSDIPLIHQKPYVEKAKSSPKSSLKHNSNTSYSMRKHAKEAKTKSSVETMDLTTDRAQTQEKFSTPKKPLILNSHSSSHSSNFLVRSSSVDHLLMSQHRLLNSFHPQRSGSASLLHTPSTLINMPSGSAMNNLHTSRSGSANTDIRMMKNTPELLHHGKLGSECRTVSYSSLVNNNSLLYGEHSRSTNQNLAIARTPRMMNPNGSPYRCMGCGVSDAKFICSGCEEHWYCSVQCQNMRWPEHKLVCPKAIYSSNAGPNFIQSSNSSDH